MLVKQQITALAQRARKIDQEIDTLAVERDVLARERDALKAALAKEPGKGSYAVLPYKGPNGTWRRPIVLECSNGTVTLRPNGPTFSMLDLSAMINPRSSPVVIALARELLRVQMSESPDGAPVVPYFVFLVRPDGIRPYYEARARLEPLGISFGYELIEQNLKVDVPDYDNTATWDGTIPLEEPLMPAPGANLAESGEPSDGLTWPSTRPDQDKTAGRDRGTSAGSMSPEEGHGGAGNRTESPNDFIWPSRPGARPSQSSESTRGPTRPTIGDNSRAPRRPSLLSDAGRGDSLKGKGIGGRGFSSLPSEGEGSPGLGASNGDLKAQGSGTDKTGSGAGGASENVPAPTIWPSLGQERLAGPGAGTARGGTSSGDSGEGSGMTSLPDLEPAGTESLSLPPAGGSRLSSQTKDGAGNQGGAPPPSISSGSRINDRSQGIGTRTVPALPPALSEPGIDRGSPSPAQRTESAGQPPRRLQSGTSDLTSSPKASAEPNPLVIGSQGAAAADPSKQPFNLGTTQNGPDSSTDSESRAGSRPPPDLSGALSAGVDAPDTANSSNAKGFSSINPSPGMGSVTSSSGSPPSGASGLVLGTDASSSSGKADDSSALPKYQSRIKEDPKNAVGVPFEIVVVCGLDGLVIHPGGYHITGQSLQSGGKDGLLIQELRAVVQQRAAADPALRPQPRVKFLLESGGSESFWAARKQVLFSGLNWPMSLQVTGTQDPHLLGKETW
jgi:hypothetical protein